MHPKVSPWPWITFENSDFYSSFHNGPGDDRYNGYQRGHNFSYCGYNGKDPQNKQQKFKKPFMPKSISLSKSHLLAELVVRKIHPGEEDFDDESENNEMKYWWEQLIVGNRRTKISQKREKVPKETNRRTWKKNGDSEKKNLSSSFVMNSNEPSDQSSETPLVVQEVENSSNSESMPQVVTGIMSGDDSSDQDSQQNSSDEDQSEDHSNTV